jgi:hypothetical protein
VPSFIGRYGKRFVSIYLSIFGRQLRRIRRSEFLYFRIYWIIHFVLLLAPFPESRGRRYRCSFNIAQTVKSVWVLQIADVVLYTERNCQFNYFSCCENWYYFYRFFSSSSKISLPCTKKLSSRGRL